jgi:hypothetical protein
MFSRAVITDFTYFRYTIRVDFFSAFLRNPVRNSLSSCIRVPRSVFVFPEVYLQFVRVRCLELLLSRKHCLQRKLAFFMRIMNYVAQFSIGPFIYKIRDLKLNI